MHFKGVTGGVHHLQGVVAFRIKKPQANSCDYFHLVSTTSEEYRIPRLFGEGTARPIGSPITADICSNESLMRRDDCVSPEAVYLITISMKQGLFHCYFYRFHPLLIVIVQYIFR